MNHTYQTFIRMRVWFNQTWMVNQLKVGLVWHVWLDWIWSILWAKLVIKTNEKRKKKEHVYFPFQTPSFSNVWMPPWTRILCSMHRHITHISFATQESPLITFYAYSHIFSNNFTSTIRIVHTNNRYKSTHANINIHLST